MYFRVPMGRQVGFTQRQSATTHFKGEGDFFGDGVGRPIWRSEAGFIFSDRKVGNGKGVERLVYARQSAASIWAVKGNSLTPFVSRLFSISLCESFLFLTVIRS
jgi:hypothetical protein